MKEVNKEAAAATTRKPYSHQMDQLYESSYVDAPFIWTGRRSMLKLYNNVNPRRNTRIFLFKLMEGNLKGI